MDVGTPTAVWVVVNTIAGLGLGFLFPSLAFAIQAAAASSDVGYAVSMFTFFRAFGQTFGVAMGGVIFQNGLASELARFPDAASATAAAEYAQDAVAFVTLIQQLPESDPQRALLVQSYAGALKQVWLFLFAFALLAFLISGLTQPLSLDMEHETDQMPTSSKRVSMGVPGDAEAAPAPAPPTSTTKETA